MLKRAVSEQGWTESEEGSVMIAVLVITVLSFLVAGVLTSVSSGLNSARTDQDRTDAFQHANAGIDQGLYRIDAKNLPPTSSGNYAATSLTPDGVVAAFTETFTEDGQTFEITASADPPGQDMSWLVRSVGTDLSGRQRQAVARVEAQSLFEDGFFTFDYTYLNGSATHPVAYDSSTDPTASTQLALPLDTSIGTNDTIQLVPATADDWNATWRSYNMYGRATIEAATDACEGCDTDKVKNFTDRKEPIVMAVPDAALPCPNGGEITGAIAPGDYTCPVLKFTGTVTVSGGSGNARFWPTETLIFEDAVVNRHQVPARFQVFYYDPRVHNESLPESTAQNMMKASYMCRPSKSSEVWGLMYTPALTIACGGSNQPSIYGAVAARVYDGKGGPQFKFHWDAASYFDVHTGKYRIIDWRECAPDAALGDC